MPYASLLIYEKLVMYHLEVSLPLGSTFSTQWKQVRPKGEREENAGEGEDLASRNECHELAKLKTTFQKNQF